MRSIRKPNPYEDGVDVVYLMKGQAMSQSKATEKDVRYALQYAGEKLIKTIRHDNTRAKAEYTLTPSMSKETSPDLASLAAKYLGISDEQMAEVPYPQLFDTIRQLAGSVLSQREIEPSESEINSMAEAYADEIDQFEKFGAIKAAFIEGYYAALESAGETDGTQPEGSGR